MKRTPGKWARARSASLSSSRVINHPPACVNQEAVDPLVVGPLWQVRSRESLLEYLIQFQGSGSHFFERKAAPLNPEQLFPMVSDIDQDLAGPQGVDAAVEQPDQVHGMLGLVFTGLLEIAPH